VNSAGSDHVYVCRNPQQVHKRFNEIMEGTSLLGKSNVEIVLQEFLEGKEYVVDTVSLNGVHKCVAIWEYDKRPVNGRDFVYFGCRLKSAEEKKFKDLIQYEFKVLDALGMKNGAGHGEVVSTPDGPKLVEVGARCHGAEGDWVPLCNRGLGYSQVKVLVDTYLDPEAFHTTPVEPILNDWHCMKCDLVSYEEGILAGLPLLGEVQALKTYLHMDMLAKIGKRIFKTVDCVTIPGSVLLAGQDRFEVEADFLRIHEMTEKPGFFQFQQPGKSPGGIQEQADEENESRVNTQEQRSGGLDADDNDLPDGFANSSPVEDREDNDEDSPLIRNLKNQSMQKGAKKGRKT